MTWDRLRQLGVSFISSGDLAPGAGAGDSLASEQPFNTLFLPQVLPEVTITSSESASTSVVDSEAPLINSTSNTTASGGAAGGERGGEQGQLQLPGGHRQPPRSPRMSMTYWIRRLSSATAAVLDMDLSYRDDDIFMT